MKIEEKIARHNTEDVIEIGEILEKFYNSSAGTIVRAIIEGIIQEEISQRHEHLMSADRRLGRCEGAQTLRDRIEQAIQDKKAIIEPLQED